jgi:hypothetical protein
MALVLTLLKKVTASAWKISGAGLWPLTNVLKKLCLTQLLVVLCIHLQQDDLSIGFRVDFERLIQWD